MRREVAIIRSLLRLLGRWPWTIPLVAFLGTISSLAEGIGIGLFIPLLRHFTSPVSPETPGPLANMIDRLTSAVPFSDSLAAVCMLILLSVIIKGGITYANRYVFEWITMRLGHRLRRGIFEQLLTVGYRFLEQADSGSHLNTLSTETWRVTGALSTLHALVVNLCTAAVFLVILLTLSWKLTGVVLLAIFLIALSVRILTRNVRKLGQEASSANALLAKRMVEGLAGMRVIRLFGRERYEVGRFGQASDHVGTAFFRIGVTGAAVGPVYEILSAVLVVGLIFFSGVGGMDFPTLTAFILLLYRLEPRVMGLDEARISIVSAGAAIEEVESLLDRRGKPYPASGTAAFSSLTEGIRFREITFRYSPENRPALHDVSIAIPRGKTTAIVGPSGAGKSTLVKLLLRLYDPDEGAVLVDGAPLLSFDIASWRSRIAMVSQDVFLFDATIRENIAYGKPGATIEEIREAARQADAEQFIEQLPSGYWTVVGDRGSLLSSGQQQRIALARAIIRDPDILVLDEAMNALDAITEEVIQDAMDILCPGRTVIVIAHRRSTIARADHVVVLDEGRVHEEGNLETLQKSSGLFSRLYPVSSPVA